MIPETMAMSHLRHMPKVGSNGVFASLCNVESLEQAIQTLPPSGPIIQVNHFVSTLKPPKYAVYYRRPVCITELVPGSTHILEMAPVPTPLRLDPIVRTDVYAIEMPSGPWRPVVCNTFLADCVFRLVKSSVPACLVVHKDVGVYRPGSLEAFQRGETPWTFGQLDIFVPRCPTEERRLPVPVSSEAASRICGTATVVSDDPMTPRISLTQYDFALVRNFIQEPLTVGEIS